MYYTVLDAAAMFFLYGFFGWILEVVYYGITEKQFVNRGFLNGPICPIYGVGGTIVVLCLTPLKQTPPLLFVCSMVLTSIIELITGYVLEKIYHIRWWDYSERKFNIGGYICLRFSVYWGFACMALMYFIHPMLYDLTILPIGNTIKLIVTIALGSILIADIITTINTLKNLQIRMERIDALGKRMRMISDGIGKKVYEKTEEAMKKGEQLAESERAKELREDIDDYLEKIEQERQKWRKEMDERNMRFEQEREKLKCKHNKLITDMNLFQRRIIKAFPSMKSNKYEEISSKIKEVLKNKKR